MRTWASNKERCPAQGPDIEDKLYQGVIPRMVWSIFDGIYHADEHIEFLVKAGAPSHSRFPYVKPQRGMHEQKLEPTRSSASSDSSKLRRRIIVSLRSTSGRRPSP